MILDKEQIYHLIDLLEINIKEKLLNPPSFMNEELIADAIKYDKSLILVLKKML